MLDTSVPPSAGVAAAVALGHDGRLLGRARLLRLYGARGELTLAPVPDDLVVLALLDEIEDLARQHNLIQLELPGAGLPAQLLDLVRRTRGARVEARARHPHLTWPLTPIHTR